VTAANEQLGGDVLGDRYLVISADTHNAPPADVYRPYLEKAHLEAFEDDLAQDGAFREYLQHTLFVEFAAHAVPDGATDEEKCRRFEQNFWEGRASWEPSKWVAAQEADGVVASVLQELPSPTGPPFARSRDRDLRLAGKRSYNRWLADFCSEIPGRAAGVIAVPDFDDVAAVVLEICQAAESGLRGGLGLPGMSKRRPGFHDPMYDPIWATCEAYGIPIVAHAGRQQAGTKELYGDGPIAQALANYDSVNFDRRPLWFMILGGVFDRFPDLRLCFTEQYADWVPFEIGRLRGIEQTYFMVPVRSRLSLTPEEYWYRNCVVCASFMSRTEAEAREQMGLGNIMWGSDFPHPEGTYPLTRQSLRHTFARVPAPDVRMILGETAARVHHFDLDALAPIAAAVGPTIEELAAPFDEVPEGYFGWAFRSN
jgi:predicted TIM-barrel fold metal-dependent hydrolase